ncbi:MAG: thiamine phosphate synthase [Faecousia sp.]
MAFDKNSLLLYAVTDRAWVGRQTLQEQIEAALLGGVTMVQLREKHLDEEAFIREAQEIRELCQKYGVPLIINDNVEVALKSGADGVHVGIEDAPVAEIRRRVGRDFIIGATAKTVAQARAAEAAGADYLGVGAVFPSPTKKAAIRITTEKLREICASVSIPAVAIGGITTENLGQLTGGGMAGIAVVSALFGAQDIRHAAAKLKSEAIRVTSL